MDRGSPALLRELGSWARLACEQSSTRREAVAAADERSTEPVEALVDPARPRRLSSYLGDLRERRQIAVARVRLGALAAALRVGSRRLRASRPRRVSGRTRSSSNGSSRSFGRSGRLFDPGVERFASGFDVVLVRDGPAAERVDRFAERITEVGERVVHAGRRARRHGAGNEAGRAERNAPPELDNEGH